MIKHHLSICSLFTQTFLP